MWSSLLAQKPNPTRQVSNLEEHAGAEELSQTRREVPPVPPVSEETHPTQTARSSINVMDFIGATNVSPVVHQGDGAHNDRTDSDVASFRSFESRNDPARSAQAQYAADIIAIAVPQETALSSRQSDDQAGRRLTRDLPSASQMSDPEGSPTRDMAGLGPSIPDRVASVAPRGTIGIIPGTTARFGDARRSVGFEQSPVTQSETFPAIVVSPPQGTKEAGKTWEVVRQMRSTENENVDDERQYRPATPTQSVRSMMCRGMTYLHRCPGRSSAEHYAESTAPLSAPGGTPGKNKAPSNWRKLTGTLWAKVRWDVIFRRTGNPKRKGRPRTPRQYHGYPG